MLRFYRTRRNWFLGYIVLGLIAAPFAARSGPPAYQAEVLGSFSGADGAAPGVELVRDAASGNLYGTTYAGGAFRRGTVFELTPAAKPRPSMAGAQGPAR